MGLDMYLHATRYESNYGFQIAENGENETFKTILQTVGGYVSPESPLVEISLTIGYWRKVNAIHNWFVNELADGKDECQRIDVNRSELQQLSEICKAVLADHSSAEELLPTGSGFFFGGTEYDEWYFEGLKDTVAQIKEALALDSNWGFYYQASW
jgi:hypothetical protein